MTSRSYHLPFTSSLRPFGSLVSGSSFTSDPWNRMPVTPVARRLSRRFRPSSHSSHPFLSSSLWFGLLALSQPPYPRPLSRWSFLVTFMRSEEGEW